MEDEREEEKEREHSRPLFPPALLQLCLGAANCRTAARRWRRRRAPPLRPPHPPSSRSLATFPLFSILPYQLQMDGSVAAPKTPRPPPSSSCPCSCCCCGIWLRFLCNTQQILSLRRRDKNRGEAGRGERLQEEEEEWERRGGDIHVILSPTIYLIQCLLIYPHLA